MLKRIDTDDGTDIENAQIKVSSNQNFLKALRNKYSRCDVLTVVVDTYASI